MRARTAPLLIGALLLAACGGNAFEADDPNGYEACQRYADAAEITDDPMAHMQAAFDAGDHARRAATPEIRDAAQPVAGSWLVDDDAMAAACEANGVDIP